MGKRNNEKKTRQQPLPTKECAICNELRQHWKGQIKTIDRQHAVDQHLKKLTSDRALIKQGLQGQSTIFKCQNCHHQWQYSFLDNCVPGGLAD